MVDVMSKEEEFLIKRGNNQYEVVIGLEVHAQVTSKSKLFSPSLFTICGSVLITHSPVF